MFNTIFQKAINTWYPDSENMVLVVITYSNCCCSFYYVKKSDGVVLVPKYCYESSLSNYDVFKVANCMAGDIMFQKALKVTCTKFTCTDMCNFLIL